MFSFFLRSEFFVFTYARVTSVQFHLFWLVSPWFFSVIPPSILQSLQEGVASLVYVSSAVFPPVRYQELAVPPLIPCTGKLASCLQFSESRCIVNPLKPFCVHMNLAYMPERLLLLGSFHLLYAS